MVASVDARRLHAVLLLRDAVVTFVVMLFAYGAFDDITTDNSTDFTFEYVVLGCCALWLLFAGLRLLRIGYRVLGCVSLLALAAAVWGQRGIGPGITPGLWPEYVVTVAAVLWFTTLSVVLLVLGWRAHPDRLKDPNPSF